MRGRVPQTPVNLGQSILFEVGTDVSESLELDAFFVLSRAGRFVTIELTLTGVKALPEWA